MSYLLKNSDFSLRKQLLLFLGKSFLVTDITEFSSEAKETFKWVNTTKNQIEIIMISSKMRNCAAHPDHSHSEKSCALA